MRRTILAALAISAVTLTGCGTNSTDTATGGTPTVKTDTATTEADKVAAYTTLAEEFNGWFLAATASGEQPTGPWADWPGYENARLYDFAEGVELHEFSSNGACLTGPNDTYYSFTQTQRTFGTGECDPTDGDIVLVLIDKPVEIEVEGPGPNDFVVAQKVTKGQELVAQIPAISEYRETIQ